MFYNFRWTLLYIKLIMTEGMYKQHSNISHQTHLPFLNLPFPDCTTLGCDGHANPTLLSCSRISSSVNRIFMSLAGMPPRCCREHCKIRLFLIVFLTDNFMLNLNHCKIQLDLCFYTICGKIISYHIGKNLSSFLQ